MNDEEEKKEPSYDEAERSKGCGEIRLGRVLLLDLGLYSLLFISNINNLYLREYYKTIQKKTTRQLNDDAQN